MARTQVEKEKLKRIRQEIKESTIPDELKALYMMADATELMSTQTFIRIKQVFARNGYTVNENDLLTGITNYCRTIKQATFQFYERIDPQIADATFFASRDENDPNFVGGANAYDHFNDAANELCRLVLLHIDRTAKNDDGFRRVFKTLRQLPSGNIFTDEDIAKYKMKKLK